MGIEFDCPVGPKADESELLYISALHQTGTGAAEESEFLRQDASVYAEDIRCYLISRYGIVVTTEMVETMILNKNSSLDLISLVAALFVPTFMKLLVATQTPTPIDERTNTRAGNVNVDIDNTDTDTDTICPRVLEKVLEMILHDVTGDTEPKPLTISLLRDIFQKYGEDAVASDDEQLEQILQAATGGKNGVLLNEESLLRALTHDLRSFNVHQEAEMSTNFNDVFGDDCYECSGIQVRVPVPGHSENDAGDSDVDVDVDVVGERTRIVRMIKRINTGKAIDFIAGTYSCKYQVMCVWSFFVFTFMGYGKKML